jgi:hypothetical protein
MTRRGFLRYVTAGTSTAFVMNRLHDNLLHDNLAAARNLPVQTADECSDEHSKEPVNIALESYLTYPHTNGFSPDGRAVFVVRRNGPLAELWRYEFPSLQGSLWQSIAWDQSGGREALYFDIALRTPRLVVFDYQKLSVFDLDQKKLLREFKSPEGSTFQLGSLSPDGRKLVVGMNHGVAPGATNWEQFKAGVTKHEIVEFDVVRGDRRSILLRDWWINHVQLSPFDSSWIGFCHEGDARRIADRVWAYHSVKMPEGRVVFAQKVENGAGHLHTSHEIWAYDRNAVFTVVHQSSPSGPKGVYEIFPDENKARLVSPGEYDWHVGVSRDGRWLAIDTNGPHEPEIYLVHAQSGRRAKIGEVGPGNWRHPYHPHPVFSPDTKYVLWNDRAHGVRMKDITEVQKRLASG